MITLWFVIGQSFHLHHLVHFLRQMGLAEGQGFKTVVVADENLRLYQEYLVEAEIPLTALRLNTSLNAVRDFCQAIERHFSMGFEIKSDEIQNRAFNCFKVIQWECEHVLCVRVEDQDDAIAKADAFVRDRFPGAIAELEEAQRCLGGENSTACVFHCMRGTEYVLKALWKTLGIEKKKTYESWGDLLKPMDLELAKTPKEMLPLWSANTAFFAEVIFDLRAAKKAYRDPTMHVENSYDPRSATAIFAGTLTLISDAAKHLDQEGNFIA